MKTKTFTLLLTISDDGNSNAFKPDFLAAAIEGALELGVRDFALDSARGARLGVISGEHSLLPVLSATCDVLEGDVLRSAMSTTDPIVGVRRIHRLMHG